MKIWEKGGVNYWNPQLKRGGGILKNLTKLKTKLRRPKWNFQRIPYKKW